VKNDRILFAMATLYISWKRKLEKELKTSRKRSVKRPQKSWNVGKSNKDKRQRK